MAYSGATRRPANRSIDQTREVISIGGEPASPPNPPRLLDQGADRERSTLRNLLLNVVRAGHDSHEDVIVAACDSAGVRDVQAASHGAPIAEISRRIRGLINEHADEACDLAVDSITWCDLPSHERERIETEFSHEYCQRWVEQQPPADRQIACLREHGCCGPIGRRTAVSTQIERLAAGWRR